MQSVVTFSWFVVLVVVALIAYLAYSMVGLSRRVPVFKDVPDRRKKTGLEWGSDMASILSLVGAISGGSKPLIDQMGRIEDRLAILEESYKDSVKREQLLERFLRYFLDKQGTPELKELALNLFRELEDASGGDKNSS